MLLPNEGDTNGDGIRSVAESGDFKTVVCGCPDEAGDIATPTPTAGVQVSTQAPAPAIIVESTMAPVPAIEPTVAPFPAEPALAPNTTQVRAAIGNMWTYEAVIKLDGVVVPSSYGWCDWLAMSLGVTSK